MKYHSIPKEISWLSFNERVLQEAADRSNSLRSRINFLGIYSNNLDEFFRVRVATLRRISQLGKKAEDILGYNPQTVLKQIFDIVVTQQKLFANAYDEILLALKKNNVFIVKETELNENQKVFLNSFFVNKVRPHLMPIMLNQIKNTPQLQNDMVYLAVSVLSNNKTHNQYAIVQIPTDVIPRFIELPTEPNCKNIIFLDDVIRFGLKNLFHLFDIQDISAYTIKITKDAELDINDDISESYIDKVALGLRKRKVGEAVRFIYDRNMPQGLLKLFLKKLNIGKSDTIIPGGRYHNFKDFLKFPDSCLKKNTEIIPEAIPCPCIQKGESIFEAIEKNDIILHFPYQSFDHFIDLLRDASIDPMVKRISITLYRLAKNSAVINALVNAARNGKEVLAVMELQARFDEEANLNWSNLLHEEGVKVIYGVPGLKVHAKVCLIEREENNKHTLITCISTGNFNENTSKIYTDLMLLTANPKISREARKAFAFFAKNYTFETFNHLILSPFSSRKKISTLISNEIKNQEKGLEAYIKIKLNNLVDKDIIQLLLKASDAGVKIQLQVRGMNSLKPDKYKNIKAFGIVDKYLEHSRIMIFANGGDEKVFISSSDLMTRNLDRRVEVICPIYDPRIKTTISDFFDISYKDNVKARIINDNLTNQFRKRKANEAPFRSQEEMFNYMKEKFNN